MQVFGRRHIHKRCQCDKILNETGLLVLVSKDTICKRIKETGVQRKIRRHPALILEHKLQEWMELVGTYHMEKYVFSNIQWHTQKSRRFNLIANQPVGWLHTHANNHTFLVKYKINDKISISIGLHFVSMVRYLWPSLMDRRQFKHSYRHWRI